MGAAAALGAGVQSFGSHGMSSGPILQTSVATPAAVDAVYVLFNAAGEKKHFKDEVEMREFLKDNEGWSEQKKSP